MSVRRSMTWMLGSQGGLFFLQFGGSVALARLLTPYEMGVYAIAAAVIGIIGIIQSFGVGLYVIREAEINLAILASAFTMNMVLSIILSAGIVGLSILGSAFLGAPGVRSVMLVLAIIPLIGIFEFTPVTMLERNAKFRAIAGLNVARAICSTITTIALATQGFSYMSIAWGAVAGTLAGAVGSMTLGRQHVCLRMSLSEWRSFLQFGLQQLAIQGINSIAGRLSDFVLGRLLGLEALGLWGRASNLNNLLWGNLYTVIGRVMMVNLAEQQRAGQSLRTVYLRTVQVLTALLWPSFTGLAILARPFIATVYGLDWIAAAPPLAGLALWGVIAVSLTLTWEVFVVKQETARQTRLEFIRTAVGFVLFVGGCLSGLVMASLARVGEALFSVMLYRPHIERMTDTHWQDYSRIYRQSALLTAAACGPALILMLAFGWSAAVPILFVLASVVVGVILWLITLFALAHPLAEEIGRFINKGREIVGFS
ncbi:MAG: oligosaccharide flippase family protein [Janthinobacterium lividum]